MSKVNPHFQRLKSAYIFPVIEQKLAELKKENPHVEILNFGVGDIALPLCPSIAAAINEATMEMTTKEGMRGYGPSEGYLFLREAILKNLYSSYNFSPDEIFISEGTNTDIGAIQDLFDNQCTIAVPDPSYPAYRDISLLSGKEVFFLPCLAQNGCIPRPPKERADLVYLCNPSNPTGVAFSKNDLKIWVDWARENRAILCIDSVYSSFIRSKGIPQSIYAIDGAKEVAIEMNSFSKCAGFTGLRCGYMILPKALKSSENISLNALWKKRTSIKSNGVSYPIQKGALAAFSKKGKQETLEQINTYLEVGKILRNCLEQGEQTFFGGMDCPYIFWQIPKGFSSWTFFDKLLEHCQIIGIPGNGFGEHGEGFLRLSCFSTIENAHKATLRLTQFFYEIFNDASTTRHV